MINDKLIDAIQYKMYSNECEFVIIGSLFWILTMLQNILYPKKNRKQFKRSYTVIF